MPTFAANRSRHTSLKEECNRPGLRFFIWLMRYSKQILTLAEQIEVLKQRGLIIGDESEAMRLLDQTGYFRLADYWRPMEEDRETRSFLPNTSFDHIVRLYRFDAELKQLVFNGILRIEVATRSKMIRYFSDDHGPFWFMDETLAEDAEWFSSNISTIRREVARSQEDFIKEHFNKYDEPDLPPVWKTLEVLSFGTLSKLFNNFNDTTAKDLMAADFGLPTHTILGSWLGSLTVLRNKCAHHARVWNRRFPIMPELPRKAAKPWIANRNLKHNKLYPQLCCIAYLLNIIDPQNTFVTDFKTLLRKYPAVDPRAMGCPTDWEQEPLWRQEETTSEHSHWLCRLFKFLGGEVTKKQA